MLIRSEFIEYIKRVENGGKSGFDFNTSSWFPHTSPEGGNDTIGYGHKLRDNEHWMKEGVSDAYVEDLLFKDIVFAAESASEIVNEYPESDFEFIPQRSQEIFTDFVFNLGGGGFRKFPKLINATLSEDTETMRNEYKRYYRNGYGELKELEQRNSEFYKMFLT